MGKKMIISVSLATLINIVVLNLYAYCPNLFTKIICLVTVLLCHWQSFFLALNKEKKDGNGNIQNKALCADIVLLSIMLMRFLCIKGVVSNLVESIVNIIFFIFSVVLLVYLEKRGFNQTNSKGNRIIIIFALAGIVFGVLLGFITNF